MRLRKRVIESTVVAGMMVLVTSVTAVSSPGTTPTTEKNLEVTVENNGIAGITSELASIQLSTELDLTPKKVTVEKTSVAKVTKAVEPELTPEQKEWSNKLIANVEGSLNVRVQPDENAALEGKLRRGDRAEIVEQSGEWTHVVSGNVDGYVKTEYCLVGMDALNFAKTECGTKATVLTNGLRIRQNPSEEAGVISSAKEGNVLDVNTEAESVEGWVTVNYNGHTAYVKAEYVDVKLGYGTGITVEEEQEMIRKAKEEAAAKAAQQAQTTQGAAVTQNASVAASADDVTLLAALIQCEAGSECYEGQVAVGAVVMNRVRSGAYPSTIYNVIYQSGQFSPAGSGKVASVIANGVSSNCVQAAQQALGGYDNTGGCLSFRNVRSGKSGVVIGNHVFF